MKSHRAIGSFRVYEYVPKAKIGKMWLGRRKKIKLVFYVKRDDVIFPLDVLIWLLYKGWTGRQKLVEQNDKLGEK